MHTLAHTQTHAVSVSHTRTMLHCINTTACAYMYCMTHNICVDPSAGTNGKNQLANQLC